MFNFAEEDREFEIGLIDGIAVRFEDLDKNQQQSMIDTIKMYKSMDLFGRFVAEKFRDLFKETQERLLYIAERNEEFAVGLARGISFQYYISEFYNTPVKDDVLRKRISELCLEPIIQERILKLAERNSRVFARLSGWITFCFLYNQKQQIQELILNLAEKNKVVRNLAAEIGLSLNLIKNVKVIEKIWQLAERNRAFAAELGYAAGRRLDDYKKFKSRILKLAKKSRDFAMGLGFGCIASRNAKMAIIKNHKNDIWTIANTNNEFAYGLGIGIAENFELLSNSEKEDLFAIISRDNPFSKGIFHGFGCYFSSLNISDANKILQLAFENKDFAKSLGRGFGARFPQSPKGADIREQIWTIANTNNEFAYGLGEGLGSISVSSLQYIDYEDIRYDTWSKALDNDYVVKGLANSLGQNFQFLGESFVNEIFLAVQKSPLFAHIFGCSIKDVFQSLDEDSKETLIGLANKNASFRKSLSDSRIDNRQR
jgi:hypothetical protein